ncbi:M24 family metallopeptidase [Atlantibacter subterranea]|uniref:M24 family metallopeptidase n=1 Tax=Atlantibacter subterraneus TaxID=255519 RepID=A0A3R9F288_9ENTR|nr:M24 family metallopeptidase [Atlantibacter subterranea]MDA3132528.1 M24 family metallopeptidase [Atlantibacter subterranea]RSB61555.1 M24 family metallopeptidase [Atlantibacter subterranea]RSE04672.1 M24 family metallopeptidase [Atlantibacter subterranea]RSE24489.1 M24 family metallopeptidase [Atlantibacter subterranea]
MTEPRRIVVKNIPQPDCWLDVPSVPLTDATLKKRKARVLARMAQLSLETLIVYADKEHGANFEYLTGFIPRFEEALLVLHQDGEAVLVLGNENLKLAAHARLENRVMHAPWFSLPNQPMTNAASLPDTLRLAGMADKKRIGVAGWKLFTSEYDDNTQLFDLPSFIVDSLRAAVTPDCVLINATGVFISPANGARVINIANELAHYEYGANLASTAILQALNAIEPGKTEKQIGALLAAEGQANNVIMIAATGERFASANLYPSDKVIQRGDKFSLTTSYKGGLSSRAAYVVANETELNPAVADYLDVVAIPYYRAVVGWLERMCVGVTGGEIYQLIETLLPKSEYHWHLNPGHLVADEEWMCSPIMPDSAIPLASGMLLQIDIIPSRAGYAGASIEDTVALADAALRAELARDYPAMWTRIIARRDYIQRYLGIRLSEDVLPLSNTVGYLRPWLLDQTLALGCAE